MMRNNEENIIKYGVIQSYHGHEYVYIFDQEGLEKSGVYEEIQYWLDGEESTCIDCGWPIGGSNSSSTYIIKLDNIDAIKNFLVSKGDGPDSEDPTLVEIAEYIHSVETSEGLAGEYLEKFGLLKEDLTSYDERYEELISLGIKPEAFYGAMRDLRYSEALEKVAI